VKPKVKADPHSGALDRLFSWWLAYRFRGREWADVRGRSRDVRVRRLDAGEAAQQAAAGYHCDAWFCRRAVTHMALFTFRHRSGQDLMGETFFCTPHALKYATRHHVAIEDVPREPCVLKESGRLAARIV
jgi:hypothetical protein